MNIKNNSKSDWAKITYISLAVLTLTGIVAMAYYMRLYKLDAWGLWMDEYITEVRINHSMAKAFAPRTPNLQSTQVYQSLLVCYHRALTWFTGNPLLSISQLRYPFAVAGVLGVIAMFFTGKAISGVPAGLFCAMLTALSGFHIYYSREARYYGVFYLACVMSIYTAWKCINSIKLRIPWKSYAIYAFIATLALGIHQGYYFLFAVLNLYLGIYECVRCCRSWLEKKSWRMFRRQFVRLIVIGAFLCIPVIIWSPTLVKKVHQADSSLSVSGSSKQAVLPTFSVKSVFNMQKKFYRKNCVLTKHITLITIIAFFVILFSRKFHFAIWWAVGISLPVYYFSRAYDNHFFHYKYILSIGVLSVILIGCASGQLLSYAVWLIKMIVSLIPFLKQKINTNNAKYIFKSLGIVIALILIVYYIDFRWQREKSSFQKTFSKKYSGDEQMFSYLDQHAQPGDIIIMYEEPFGGPYVPRWIDYYVRRAPHRAEWIFIRAKDIPSQIDKVSPSSHRVWWVMGEKSYMANSPKITKYAKAYPFGKRMLLEALKPVHSSYNLLRMTKDIYSVYAGNSKNKYITIYPKIAKQLSYILPAYKLTNKEKERLKLIKLNNASSKVRFNNVFLAELTSLQTTNAKNFVSYCRYDMSSLPKFNGKIFDKSLAVTLFSDKTAIIKTSIESNFNLLKFTPFVITGNGSVDFTVLADGKEVYCLKNVYKQSNFGSITVDIKDAKCLDLKTKSSDSKKTIQAVWGNPCLVQYPNTLYITELLKDYNSDNNCEILDDNILVKNDNIISLILDGSVNEFVSSLKFNGKDGELECEIKKDGKSAFKSPKNAQTNISIDLSNARKLELITKRMKPGNSYALWGTPHLISYRKIKYLSALSEESVSNVYYFRKNYNANITTQKFSESIFMHPDYNTSAVINYKINELYDRFESKACVLQKNGSVRFIVKCDNKKVYDSGIISGKRIPIFIDIDVHGIKLLSLEVSSCGEHYNDHAVWLNPGLLKSKPDLQKQIRLFENNFFKKKTGKLINKAYDNNLIKNSEFSKELKYWDPWEKTIKNPELVKCISVDMHGKSMQGIRITNPDGVLAGIKQTVEVTSGTVYRLSGRVRSTAVNDPHILFGGRIGFWLPPQKEKQIVWMSEHNKWWKKELVFTNQVNGMATVYVHMGYGNVASTGEFTDVRLEKYDDNQ